MNALALVQHIGNIKLGLDDSITALAGASNTILQILAAINEIQDDLADHLDVYKLKEQGEITLATDTSTYSLAADFQRFIKGEDPVYYTKVSDGDTSINRFTVVNDSQFKNHKPPAEFPEGKPYVGRLFGADANGYSIIELYGAPIVTYDGTKLYYEYIVKPTPLAADADVSVFSDNLLIEGAYLKIRISNGDAERSDLIDFLAAAEALEVNNNDSGQIKKLIYRDF